MQQVHVGVGNWTFGRVHEPPSLPSAVDVSLRPPPSPLELPSPGKMPPSPALDVTVHALIDDRPPTRTAATKPPTKSLVTIEERMSVTSTLYCSPRQFKNDSPVIARS